MESRQDAWFPLPLPATLGSRIGVHRESFVVGTLLSDWKNFWAEDAGATKTVLGVCLIHQTFSALAVVNGQPQDRWECPYPVQSGEALRRALREAIRTTDFPGQNVSFLVENDQLHYQYVQVPPMQPSDLRIYLTQQASREMGQQGPTVWRYRSARTTEGREGIMLSIWPKTYVDHLIASCEEVGLAPQFLAPLSAVLVDQIRMLPVDKASTLLLVTVMAGKVGFVVAKGDGTPLCDRFLSFTVEDTTQGNRQAERIGLEVTRTMFFALQRFDLTVDQVWFVGEAAGITADSVQPHVEIPIQRSPMAPDLAYWIWVGVMLPISHPCNFVPHAVRRAPRKKRLRRVALTLAAGVALFAVGVGTVMEGLFLSHRPIANAVAQELRHFEALQDQLTTRQVSFQQQDGWAKTILLDPPHPLAGWFLGYLAAILPSRLVLTNVSISREVNDWVWALKGLGPGDLAKSAEALVSFEQALGHGPYQITITKSWQDRWVVLAQAGGVSTEAGHYSQFAMEGRIR